MKFATTVLLATSVAGANIDLAIENMSADELDMMAQHLQEASAAKAMAVKQPDCSEEMMHHWDKFVAWNEAKSAHDKAAVDEFAKKYPGMLDKYEVESNKFVDGVHGGLKHALSPAGLKDTRTHVDHGFAKAKADLKKNIALEREWS